MNSQRATVLRRAIYFAAGVSVATFIFASGVTYAHLVQPGAERTGDAVTAPAPPAASPAAAGAAPTYAAVAERALPSVVNLAAATVRTPPTGGAIWGFADTALCQGPRQPPAGTGGGRNLGSGVIIGDDGFILTNNHLIAGAVGLRARLPGHEPLAATVVGTDPTTDLALLHVDAHELPAIVMGDSSRLRVGDVVLAIGAPYSRGHMVSMGIVSGKGRTAEGAAAAEFIRTDAEINAANSGGALVNLAGELVGINAASTTPAGRCTGIGFAIPSADARRSAETLRHHWHGTRAANPQSTCGSDLGSSTCTAAL